MYVHTSFTKCVYTYVCMYVRMSIAGNDLCSEYWVYIWIDQFLLTGVLYSAAVQGITGVCIWRGIPRVWPSNYSNMYVVFTIVIHTLGLFICKYRILLKCSIVINVFIQNIKYLFKYSNIYSNIYSSIQIFIQMFKYLFKDLFKLFIYFCQLIMYICTLPAHMYVL